MCVHYSLVMRPPWTCYCFALFLIFDFYTTAQPLIHYPTANLSTIWTNTESFCFAAGFIDGSSVRANLIRGSSGPSFACGFYCNGTCTSYLFSVFIVQTDSEGRIDDQRFTGFPQVVWSANRDHPVSYGATLNLTAAGQLVLQDVDGSIVWTTNTAGKSVVGLNLTDDGNLVLFDVNSSVAWQSFDYPTDCLVPGQRLFQGQTLIPSVSSTNWTTQKGLYSLQVMDKGLFAYVGSNPPQVYYDDTYIGNDTDKGRRYIEFLNGSLSFFISSVEPSDPYGVIPIPRASSTQYMKLMPDGHLRVFEWRESWLVVADLFNYYLRDCDYPLDCGRNALCSGNQQCSCPVPKSHMIDYFRAVDDQQPNMGCSEITLLTCNAIQDQTFIELEKVIYFTFHADMKSVDSETCKQACANNCSCKAALFQYDSDSSFGYLIAISRKQRQDTQREEEFIGELLGLPNRYSYEELKTTTENFNNKLGEGGFGAVFKGTLKDGSKIAVKCLEGFGQVNKSFLAEVQSIGSIHHVNLVTLKGFCAWKSQRFLVYEFMRNGSLDRWIYHGDRKHILEWKCRKKIILDVAKESWHLLDVLQKCWEQGTLQDIVDKYSEDMQTHSSEVLEMIKVASWCLQYDFTKRPSMSTVVKVLEGVMEVESSLNYNFTNSGLQNTTVEQYKNMTPLMASVLSGPRPLSFGFNIANSFHDTQTQDSVPPEHNSPKAHQVWVTFLSLDYPPILPHQLITESYKQETTKNFDKSLVIGSGGFGKVYKGYICHGTSLVVAAIKRLDPESIQGDSKVSRMKALTFDEEFISNVPGMPNQFSYEELKSATENFNKKLGEGASGAVFKGTLPDGSEIAVKHVKGLDLVKKVFLTEDQCIGSIHHVNVVRLQGFCALKSEGFLVYEFMSNGSLDRWIYHGVREHVLDWECRKKIILDVAKGLAYLHEELKICRCTVQKLWRRLN
ncbi:hypothetical protein M8C21_021512 [Ambrosia artemisiifolia]|uniref:Non-specific serine/threonine protein kinase n=1 Tax=Ambrosia artemisiifolia TaxID=4212 RepID=A0AAD5GVG8_AMBAR|nr:hypothetical protein M8C21_021512 [Ambrosia artemisiifolia]